MFGNKVFDVRESRNCDVAVGNGLHGQRHHDEH
jgi:hypothetical protein